ncbi:MAG: TonB-dependent receptor plug domain-containing protein [Terrimonas sp.]|nr:TonB-dependent receptor plug domain-containing protein [Terrimonas sp.]
MSFKFNCTLTLLFCFLVNSLIAQQGMIRGWVNDADTHQPLNGATINLAHGPGEDADIFGAFTISGLKEGSYQLIISYIGYKTEIIPVGIKNDSVSYVSVSMHRTGLDLATISLMSTKSSSLNTISNIDLQLRPVNTAQDVLRIVPGLFIAQHAGGGKAEQIFLRGFDLDHGTDINITVDGIPVNMVSHAHGQGYADLHFLIPETIEKINFDKGPYFVEKGNLATAGFVDISTKDFISQNILKIEAGKFATKRVAGLIKLFNRENKKIKQQFYVATEYFYSDGYFEKNQNFARFNLMGKYSAFFNNQSKLYISGSVFDSKWNASGQIPDRAVKNGTISRYGSIDDSEGGNTRRTNFKIQYSKLWKKNWQSTHLLYYTRYDFNLFSNFTFYLNDPVNGDEIQQMENRNLFGYTTSMVKGGQLGSLKINSSFGAGFRHDDIDNIHLSRTVDRRFIEYLQKGDIHETNSFLFSNQEIKFNNHFAMRGGLRFDHFRFVYTNLLLTPSVTQRQYRGIISPKLNFIYSFSPSLKIYLNNGIGFHSNDTRVILDNRAKEILPRVFGSDLGLIAKAFKRLVVKTAIWQLFSQQEFVYVGDAGIVEPGGRTQRWGVDLSMRYQLTSWLLGDLDLNLTRARAVDRGKNENYIPLAPSFTSVGGITAKTQKGFEGSIRYRMMADRPANETNTVIAKGYIILDGIVRFKIKKSGFWIAVENLLNSEWREAQFDTESRLQNELIPVSEIHYTTGSPFFIKGGISFSF